MDLCPECDNVTVSKFSQCRYCGYIPKKEEDRPEGFPEFDPQEAYHISLPIRFY